MKKLLSFLCLAMFIGSVCNAETVIPYNPETNEPFKVETFDGFSGDVTITIPAGNVIVFDATLTIPNGVNLVVKGEEGSSAVVFPVNKMSFAANTTSGSLMYDNIEFNTGGAVYIQVNTNCVIDKVAFKGCTFTKINNNLLRMDANSGVLKQIVVEECMFTEVAMNSGGDIIRANASNAIIENILVDKCTFNNISRSLINHSAANNVSTTVSNCTFYEFGATSQSLIHYGQNYKPTNGLTISNCVFGKTTNSNGRALAIKTDAMVTVTNSYTTSDYSIASGFAIPDLITTYTGSSADLFKDIASGDFKIKDEEFAGKNSAGDPRWYYSSGTGTNVESASKNEIDVRFGAEGIEILADSANTKVYTVNGVLVSQTSANYIDSSSWTKGLYVVIVEVNGQVFKYKYLR